MEELKAVMMKLFELGQRLIATGRPLMSALAVIDAKGQTLIYPVADMDERHPLIARIAKTKPKGMVLVYDGYVTTFHPGKKCPTCDGVNKEDCPDCRGSGKAIDRPKQDAITGLVFLPGRDPRPYHQRYRKEAEGRTVFEDVETPEPPGPDVKTQHGYAIIEGDGDEHAQEDRPRSAGN